MEKDKEYWQRLSERLFYQSLLGELADPYTLYADIDSRLDGGSEDEETKMQMQICLDTLTTDIVIRAMEAHGWHADREDGRTVWRYIRK